MILKASQRSGAASLAAHLLNDQDNEHIEVHELRGFMGNTLHDAFQEIEAQSLGTKCQKYMFSLSLSPPERESVSVDVFEKALDQIETKLGLTGQPRAVVFHEKDGRRHAHCVWSRIDVNQMKAIHLPHFKMKLQDVSRALYREYGWEMPRGLVNKAERNPLNYTLAEYHQAKRLQEEPKVLKAMFQDCWKRSDNGKAFANALKEKGFILAKGDKRGFVAVDDRGEVYSLSRWTGVKSKDLKVRLGNEKALPSIAQAKEQLAKVMTDRLKSYAQKVRQASLEKQSALNAQKAKLVERHRKEREYLKTVQTQRWQQESKQRLNRIPKGWRKIWSFVRGEIQAITKQNIQEIKHHKQRDAEQRQALIDRQQEERRSLQQQFLKLRAEHQKQMMEIRTYISRYAGKQQEQTPDLKKTFNKAVGRNRKTQEGENTHDLGRERKRTLS